MAKYLPISISIYLSLRITEIYNLSGTDSCNGDSGGPLVIREFVDDPWYQIGIVSYGSTICGSRNPGVYVNVTAYLAWIDSKLED